MKPSDERIEVLFDQALQRPIGPDRRAFLDQACAGDPELRVRLEALLQEHESPDSFLEPPVVLPGNITVPLPPEEGPEIETLREKVDESIGANIAAREGLGTVIGRYKILEKIGEGGFGTVYVAEQREPVKRRVALKIIKLGMDTRQVVARFEAERQALALMDHPNIAKVLDAGATDTGRPYFVMELVKGISITRYCDQEKLPTRERLNLFIQVCHAIQHAHQKGIIHRDIKPSNILVTLHDGVPVPKVIDFGIAKATQQELTEKTAYTQFQQFIGTPAYMSPEQAAMSGLDIDTRSDIYSLGVLLYELLTGSTPFDTKELLQSGPDAMQKIIRERQPVRPSTRLREKTALEVLSSGRSTFNPEFSTDLDWIVMKCLEKDRTRRYETANALADDVMRDLNNEPVVARAPSGLYRFRKLVRRNRVVFAAAAMVAAALLAGLVVSTVMFSREQNARRLADAARQAETQQKNEAIGARTKAEQERERARALRYCSDMNLAWQARRNNLGEVRALLEAHIPAAGEADLRDWEWRYLWQACRGEELFSLGPMEGEVIGLVLLPGGRAITGEVAPGVPGAVKLWDLERHQVVKRYEEQIPAVSDLAVSPDGCRVVLATWGDTVRLLDAGSLEILAKFSAATSVAKTALSADGRFLSTVGLREVSVWDLGNQQQLWTKKIVSSGFFHAPFSPDGLWLACPTGQGFLDLVRVKDGSLIRHAGMVDGVTDLAVSPDGRWLAAATDSSEVHLINLLTAQTRVLTNHAANTRVVAFSPDGRQLASAGYDVLVKLWDVESGIETASFRGHSKLISSLVYSADGQRLFTGAKDGTVRAWPSRPKQPSQASHMSPGFLTRAVSRDGRFLAAADTSGSLQIVKLDTLSQAASIRVSGSLTSLSIGLEGREIACGMADGAVQVWNVADGKISWSFQAHSTTVDVIEFSPDWNSMATTGGGQVRVWDRNASRPRLDRWIGARKDIGSLTFVPDGGTLVTATYSGIDLLSLRPGGNDREFPIVDAYAVDVSKDGSLLGVGLDDDVRVFELSSLRLVTKMAGSLGSFISVAFSPSSSRIIARDDLGVAWLWDVNSGREVGRFGGGVVAARFQPNGNSLVIATRQSCEVLRAPSLSEIEGLEKRTGTKNQ